MSMTVSRTRPTIDPRFRQRRVAVTRQRGRRRLSILLAGCLVAVLGSGTLFSLRTGLFSARHVTVRGSEHTPVATVEEVAGLLGRPPLLDVNPGLSSRRLARLPWVDKAVVTRHWPDSVTVTITERVPVAVVALSKAKVALVDATGRVLADVPSAPAGTVAMRVPVHPGRPGTVLASKALSALEVARGLPGPLRARVSTVISDRAGGVTLDLGGGLLVTLGPPTQIEAKFEALESLLAAVNLKGPALIDLTVPYEPIVTQTPAAPAG